MAAKTIDSELPRILHEWAEWARRAEGAGFPSMDVVGKMREARGGQSEGLPLGLHLLWQTPEVRRAHKAMEALMPTRRDEVRFVQLFHRVGPGPLVSLGMTYPQITERLEVGYGLIREKMKLRA